MTLSPTTLLIVANGVVAFTNVQRPTPFSGKRRLSLAQPRSGLPSHAHASLSRQSGTKLFGGFLFNPNDHGDDHESSSSPQMNSEELELMSKASGSMADFPTEAYFNLEAFAVSDLPMLTEARKERLDIEERTRDRFLYGNELTELRQEREGLMEEISAAKQARDVPLVEKLTDRVRRLSIKDAEYVYGQTMEYLRLAQLEGRPDSETEAYKKEAEEVKKCLPQFNLEGLWVGKYGSHGYEMINVTYVDNTLVAYKVTGDKNVPRGEATFLADLSPSFHEGSEKALNAIQLTESASQQWGTKELIRFPGKGQVAAEGYRNAKWMEGQLIMVGEEYFSFAWVPIGIQIFFGRPSAELTLKMLKDIAETKELKAEAKASPVVVSVNDDVDTMRNFAESCFEATPLKTEECIWLDGDDCGEHFQ